MNKIAAILIAAFVAIFLILGFMAIIGGSLAGALVVAIGIPFAFPTTTTLLLLVFMVLIIRTIIERQRKRREMKAWLNDNDDSAS
ncbi:hypothetical protein [Thalassospira mesophila]|uniref:Uncharacterized protein n=1 Tax=Thalassospira mesophila TaxID=1293891 RepID=A0A1Y2L226_9PROT|nr:hypothetical protein [Thalassospira mesophila]OSQ39530.1 hypothetical protein TMES_05770 [Thalassospira mesophila]